MVLLTVYYLVFILVVFVKVVDLNFWMIICVSLWLPAYYINEYSDLLENDSVVSFVVAKNMRQLSEKFIMLSFGIPIIGPIIAIFRINYIRKKIKEKEKIKSLR